MLRDYQQEAVDIAFAAVKDSVLRIIIEMATGAGKSHVIAALAELIHNHTGQIVLVTAPKSELVKQNAAKYRASGHECSIFSASAGAKSLEHPVVFVTPGTMINALDKLPGKVAAIINDEADGITAQIKAIIEHCALANPDLRLIGLTATPYRTGEGYIFKVDERGNPVEATKPYYDKRVFRIGTRELINMGFLNDVVTSPVPIEYDTSKLVKDRRGRFTPASVEATFTGRGRRTSDIVADLVDRHRFYRSCIIFCASREHAKEVMSSLPPGQFRYIDGGTPPKERSDIQSRFKAGRVKYLVNVDVLTVGTDLPIADHLALLRKTESDRLLQQIIGRGLRLYKDKEHCLISDYAGNLAPFIESGRDIFNPEIKAKKEKERVSILTPCPKCHFMNDFAGRPNPERLKVNREGFFTDLAGDVMEMEVYQGEKKPTLKVPFAAHYGRRCNGYRQRGPKGRLMRCSYTWQDKKCPGCDGSNDIAAKKCRHCGKELADPNRYLAKYASEVAVAPDGSRWGKPKRVHISEYLSKSKKRLIQVSFYVIGRETPLQKFYDPMALNAKAFAAWEQFLMFGFGDDNLTVQEVLNRRKRFVMPEAISWRKGSPASVHPEINLMWRLPK